MFSHPTPPTSIFVAARRTSLFLFIHSHIIAIPIAIFFHKVGQPKQVAARHAELIVQPLKFSQWEESGALFLPHVHPDMTADITPGYQPHIPPRLC